MVGRLIEKTKAHVKNEVHILSCDTEKAAASCHVTQRRLQHPVM